MSVEDNYRKLIDAYAKAQSEFLRKTRAHSAIAPKSEHPGTVFGREFATVARLGVHTDVGVRAGLQAFRCALNARSAQTALAAIDVLIAAHSESPRLEELGAMCRWAGPFVSVNSLLEPLGQLVARSPHRAVQASCLEALLWLLVGRPNIGDGDAADVASLVQALRGGYADTRYAASAEGYYYELEHLWPGRRAPDFEGIDQDGALIRLSDYLGRVVLVEFWGNWCVSCRAELPTLRALTDRLRGRPFSLIGVNSDGDIEQVQAILRMEPVGWRNVVDGSKEGPIARRWHVRTWPTAHLLDVEGRIRLRNASGKTMEEVLGKLLCEAQ